jgi:hypothetical protein
MTGRGRGQSTHYSSNQICKFQGTVDEEQIIYDDFATAAENSCRTCAEALPVARLTHQIARALQQVPGTISYIRPLRLCPLILTGR